MKEQLLRELSLLHEKAAILKTYDLESAHTLRQYEQEFEVLLTRLLTFNADKFKTIAETYPHTTEQNAKTVLDTHDDTTNSAGFYDSVAHLNNCINDSIETVNGLD